MKNSFDKKSRQFSLYAAISLCLSLGCSGSGQLETALVSGRVLVDGQPLTTGTVTFIPQRGRAAKGAIQPDGSFKLSTYRDGDGAIVGSHKTTVVAVASSSNSNLAPERREATYLIPNRYSIVEESGLTYEVKPGRNDFTLELMSK